MSWPTWRIQPGDALQLRMTHCGYTADNKTRALEPADVLLIITALDPKDDDKYRYLDLTAFSAEHGMALRFHLDVEYVKNHVVLL